MKKLKKLTRKDLLAIANRIYNPKTRGFLRLCVGKLQNGPDPTNKRRPMHCGLGELYFAMTGQQPDDGEDVTEESVARLAADLGFQAEKKQYDALKRQIRALTIPDYAKENLCSEIDDTADTHRSEEKEEFIALLDGIPGRNDAYEPDGERDCSVTEYRERSKAVAAVMREAARLLPE